MGKRCVIIGAGDFFPGDLPERLTGDLWIAADGGKDSLSSVGVEADIFIGDADSTSAPPPGTRTLLLPRRKDDTDMIAAIKYGLERGFVDFILLGGLGGARLSHTAANLQSLVFLKDHGANGVLKYKNTAAEYITAGETRVFDHAAGYFSLFAASDFAVVTIRGSLFDGEALTISRRFPLGVSNEFSGNKTLVQVDSGEVFLITEAELF